jgi:hypothetical protein
VEEPWGVWGVSGVEEGPVWAAGACWPVGFLDDWTINFRWLARAWGFDDADLAGTVLLADGYRDALGCQLRDGLPQAA